MGTVEDISLRSTRIRTPDRTELSIPNGSLATMNVENLSRRDKILFNTKLGLRYETSPDQMRYVLVQIRRLLYEHPKVETEGARNRFVSFDESALSMEIFCYVLTRDFNEFLAIREDLLLRIMDIVDAAGSGFAFPSQTVYLGRDTGVDKQKAETGGARSEEMAGGKPVAFPRLPARRYFRVQQFAALSAAGLSGGNESKRRLGTGRSAAAPARRLCWKRGSGLLWPASGPSILSPMEQLDKSMV